MKCAKSSRSNRARNRGAGTVEYAILLTAVVFMTVASLRELGRSVESRFASVFVSAATYQHDPDLGGGSSGTGGKNDGKGNNAVGVNAGAAAAPGGG